jgi:hypothetical protein
LAPTLDFANIPLSTRFNTLDNSTKNALLAAQIDIGFSADEVSKNPTLRRLLTNFSEQWGAATFELNDLTL